MAIEQSDLVRILARKDIFPALRSGKGKKAEKCQEITGNEPNERLKALTEKEMKA